MSGIVGIYRLDEAPVCRDELDRMNLVLAHRGPDGAAVWHTGAVGLGHRMLHTTPESLCEVLPLIKTATGLAITADARIDNREELLAALYVAGSPPTEVSDSTLILAAYEKWGERCPERLLGDFAFVILTRWQSGKRLPWATGSVVSNSRVCRRIQRQ